MRTFASAKNPFVSIRADEIMTADQVVLHPQGATSSEQANSPADVTSRGGCVKTMSGEAASIGIVNCFDAMRKRRDESDDEKNSDKTPNTGGTTPTRTSLGSLFCHAELLSHCKVSLTRRVSFTKVPRWSTLPVRLVLSHRGNECRGL